MKKIAVINDISGFGKCSLTAAIPVISAFKMQCCPLPTAVLSNQTGYDSYRCVDLTGEMPLFIEEWKKLGAEFDGILTGFISNPKQGEIIENFIKDFKGQNTLVVVDPVMADDGVIYDTYESDSVNAVKNIAKLADVITPNLTEFCILCEKDFKEVFALSGEALLNEVEKMCREYAKGSNKKIVVTGIKAENEMQTAIFENGSFATVSSEYVNGSFSGTGDILASFVTASLVGGETLYNSVLGACNLISKSLKSTMENDHSNKNYYADGVDFEKFLAF